MKENWSTKSILLFLGAVLALVLGVIIAYTGAWALALIPLILGCLVLGYYIFKNPFLGYLLIIFFLPFERVPTVDIGGINLKINTILGFLTLFAWLGAAMFNSKRWKIRPNALAWPLTLFVIALLLSLTQAYDLNRALQVLIFSLFTIALSVMTVNMVPNLDALKKIIYVLFISSVVVGIFGLLQFGGDVIGLPRTITLLKEGYDSKTFGFPRIQAFSMEPLFFANYLLIPLSLALAYFFGRVKLIKQWWLIGILVLLLVNFVLTVSRGGYLGLVATMLIFMIFYFKQVFTKRNIIILVVLAVVGGGVAFALGQSEYRATGEFLGHITLQDAKKGSESVQGRLNSFESAFSIFNRYPLSGIGIGNFGPYIKNFPPQTPAGGWPVVNNEFIEILTETGLAGAITYGLILLVLIWRSIMAIRLAQDPILKNTMFGLFAAFVGVMVQYNFFSTLYIIHIWILIGLMIAVQNIILSQEKALRD